MCKMNSEAMKRWALGKCFYTSRARSPTGWFTKWPQEPPKYQSLLRITTRKMYLSPEKKLSCYLTLSTDIWHSLEIIGKLSPNSLRYFLVFQITSSDHNLCKNCTKWSTGMNLRSAIWKTCKSGTKNCFPPIKFTLEVTKITQELPKKKPSTKNQQKSKKWLTSLLIQHLNNQTNLTTFRWTAMKVSWNNH